VTVRRPIESWSQTDVDTGMVLIPAEDTGEPAQDQVGSNMPCSKATSAWSSSRGPMVMEDEPGSRSPQDDPVGPLPRSQAVLSQGSDGHGVAPAAVAATSGVDPSKIIWCMPVPSCRRCYDVVDSCRAVTGTPSLHPSRLPIPASIAPSRRASRTVPTGRASRRLTRSRRARTIRRLHWPRSTSCTNRSSRGDTVITAISAVPSRTRSLPGLGARAVMCC